MDDWQQYRALNKKLTKLEKAQRQQAGAPQNWDDYEFLILPTCPPSTSVILRGGLCWLSASGGEGWGWYVDSYTVDLTDPNNVRTSTSYYNYTYTFINPYWYAGCVVTLTGGLAPSVIGPDGNTYGLHPATFPKQGFTLAGTMHWTSEAFEEYETAQEAEAAIMGMSIRRASTTGLPLAAIVLRNDGNVTEPLRFMPIDAVNRGRSYKFLDMRTGLEIE